MTRRKLILGMVAATAAAWPSAASAGWWDDAVRSWNDFWNNVLPDCNPCTGRDDDRAGQVARPNYQYDAPNERRQQDEGHGNDG